MPRGAIFFNTKMKEKIATAKLERQVINSMRNYFEKEGFVEIFPPKIVRLPEPVKTSILCLRSG